MPREPHATSWTPLLKGRGGPVYLAIADAISADIAAGKLLPGTRLPAQRILADLLDIDFTTVTRAYAEAAKRGLVEGRVGHGTYVRLRDRQAASMPSRQVDVSMNLPPRFENKALEERMKAGIEAVAFEGLDLFLTYQDPAGAPLDRNAGAHWLASRLPDLSPERVVVCPGTQGASVVALSLLAHRGDSVCTESLTYPGFLALGAHLGFKIAPVAIDANGLLPEAFEAVCKIAKPKVLYCTPTLHNPTTATIPLARRKQIVEIARRYDVRIIEDDAYGALPSTITPPLASLAPEIAYYIGGLAKCLSPALRTSYLVTPDSRIAARAASAVRAFFGMASPLTAAIATRWIGDGTAGAVLDAIRKETSVRRTIAARILPDAITKAECFHAWLELPGNWTAGALASRARLEGIGLASADAFAIGKCPEAIRIGLGSPKTAAELARGLEIIADLLERPPGSSSTVV